MTGKTIRALRFRGGRAVRRVALVVRPAVVGEHSEPAAWPEIDFLPVLLAAVGEIEAAGCAVERESPRVAQAVSRDSPPRAWTVDVDPEQLSQPCGGILAAVSGPADRTAVAEAQVEEPAGPERELAAAVPWRGLVHAQ
jgi:hypothetical protein